MKYIQNHSYLRRIIWLLILGLFLTSCARIKYQPPADIQTGLASWYGPQFHGKLTSSREVFNMYDLTAAHRTLPFGTKVIVTNLKNGKSVIVKINDRGPFVRGRIIDLSYAAAKMLDMVAQGVVPVRIEVLGQVPVESAHKNFIVQVGAFVFEKNARHLKQELEKKYKGVYIALFKTSNQTYYRVRIRVASMEEAQKLAEELVKDGYSVFIIEKEPNSDQ